MPVSIIGKSESTDKLIPSDPKFNFPFEPYKIQIDFMNVAYETFQERKFALLESPTGTGKSLSLICSALTWLRDFQDKRIRDLEAKRDELIARMDEMKKEEDLSGDWLTIQTRRQDLQKELVNYSKQIDGLNKIEERSTARRKAKLHNEQLDISMSITTDITKTSGSQSTETSSQNQLINDTSILMNRDETDHDIETRIKDQELYQVTPKIYYASRTHSQLSQFINEVKKTKFSNLEKCNPIKVAPLASRANLCVNPDVIKLKEPNAINERCAELLRETSADKTCPYVKIKQINILKEEVLSSVQDIEDIVKRGRSVGACPYYANRMAIAEAELVVVPYNNLLHGETRKATSLTLQDSVVIVDEAHNILETICSIHSCQISGLNLIGSHTILSRYLLKYKDRMNPKNADMVKYIIQCLTLLIKFLNEPKKCNIDAMSSIRDKEHDSPTKDMKNKSGLTNSTQEQWMLSVSDLIRYAGIESFNIFKMLDFLNRSQLARKLQGFHLKDPTIDLTLDINNAPTSDDNEQKPKKRKRLSGKVVEQKDSKKSSEGPETSISFILKGNRGSEKKLLSMTSYPLFNMIEFLRSLTNLTEDGKILVDHKLSDVSSSILKFILLNSSSQFQHITTQARSIVLAGGTMQPFSEFVDLLFGPLNIEPSRIVTFTCDHVISVKQIFFGSLSLGPTNKTLELNFKTRNSMDTIDDYGRTIMNISMVVPGGMVCFFPSYDYEQLCFNRWKMKGFISSIESRSKMVLREPRVSTQLKPIWDEFSRLIEKGKDKKRGALLLCVVGGRMSEGINFNDDLGRCVVMVGMPFANIKSAELQQKMSYYDRTCTNSIDRQRSPGQQYYENLCIKGVNQSIGRAVRHSRDYAAIVLLDRRYACDSPIRNGLPGWMTKSLEHFDRFGPFFSSIKSFFNDIKSMNV